MAKTIKKAQAGISTSGRNRIGKNKMVTVGTAKGENYKAKTKIVSKKGDNTTTATTKTSRTLKGVLSGAPSPKKLGTDKKKITSQSFSTSSLYKRGGRISKKKK